MPTLPKHPLRRRPGRGRLRCHCLLLVVAACLALGACAAPRSAGAEHMPDLQATVTGDGNSVALKLQPDAAVIDVTSSGGIGRATIVAPSGSFPATVVLRLHLGSLEELRLSYDGTTLVVAAPSGDGAPVRQSVVRSPSGGEQAIDAASPYWSAVALPPAQGASAGVPIDVTLPPDFTSRPRRSLSIQWVDRFR